MGRKTFESFPNGPLPNRRNIVITRDTNYWKEGIEVAHSLDEALRLASLDNGKKFEEEQEEPEVFIIGGGQLYTEGMHRTQRLYITHIDDAPEADTFFPEIGQEWKEISREEHQKDEKNPHDYTFVIYQKTT